MLQSTYDFDNFQLDVPRKVGLGDNTPWRMNGKLTITTASDSTAG